MPTCKTCGVGSGETMTAGDCFTCYFSLSLDLARLRAETESKAGYVQHVNRTTAGYIVSDWFDGSTVASFENGREL